MADDFCSRKIYQRVVVRVQNSSLGAERVGREKKVEIWNVRGLAAYKQIAPSVLSEMKPLAC
jgi:hypothetical protein